MGLEKRLDDLRHYLALGDRQRQVALQHLSLLATDRCLPPAPGLTNLQPGGFPIPQGLGLDPQPLRQHLELFLLGKGLPTEPATHTLQGDGLTPVAQVEFTLENGGPWLIPGRTHCGSQAFGKSNFFIHAANVPRGLHSQLNWS
ncbi:hypothetical protein Q427_30935 [Halomonas sp. BC04]|nr:hypothetical protein Q427_30935 [Halomonas sp. BC04]